MCAPRCCPGGGSRSVLQAAASWAPSGLTCQARPLRQSGVLGSQPPCVRDWDRSGFAAAWCELSLFPASNSESAPGALTGIKCLPGRPHPPKLLTQQLPGPPALHLEVGTVPPAGFTPLPCQVLLRLSLRGGLGWPWILEGTSREGRVSFYKEEAWTHFQAEAALASKVGSGEPLVAQRCHKNVGFQVPEGTPRWSPPVTENAALAQQAAAPSLAICPGRTQLRGFLRSLLSLGLSSPVHSRRGLSTTPRILSVLVSSL